MDVLDVGDGNVGVVSHEKCYDVAESLAGGDVKRRFTACCHAVCVGAGVKQCANDRGEATVDGEQQRGDGFGDAVIGRDAMIEAF